MKTCLPLLGTTRISCDCTLAGKRSAWFTRREAIERPRERESGREGERSLARRVLRIIRKEKKTVELFFLLLFFLPFFNFYRTSERWCRGKELISKNLNRSPDEKRDYSKRGTNSYHVIVSLKQRSSSDHLFSTQRIARLTSTCSLLLSDLVCVTRRWNARIRSALPYK